MEISQRIGESFRIEIPWAKSYGLETAEYFSGVAMSVSNSELNCT